jgi:hypothetical protein
MDHNLAKGNAFLGSVQNETDYKNFRTCKDCHDPSSPDYDPNAPAPVSPIHGLLDHLDKMSCQACHVSYRLASADLVVDNATTGATISYKTSSFLSADPLDPTNADKSIWHPAFRKKLDPDGKERLYPVKRLLSVWWGDWDKKVISNPDDDVISPVPLWKVRQITKGAALAGVKDDNGDGKVEVNSLAEIQLYLTALKGKDSHGNQIAKNPVLVKGGHVYYEDGGVKSFDYHKTKIKTESSHPFSVDHGVLPAKMALGAKGCQECHTSLNGNKPTPVFDRLILVDFVGPNGKPVYKPMRKLTGVNPF